MAYLGTQPNDVKKNIGLYTPSKILQLTKDGSWGGSLELIEEQTVSGVSSLIFSSIKGNVYNVHFLTINNFQPTTNDQSCRLRFFESGVEESASVYQRSQYISDNGNAEFRSTGDDKIVAIWNVSSGTDHSGVAYLYLYNLNDSSKFSYLTQQEVHMQTTASKMRQSFGGGVLPQTSTVNQIKLFVDSGNFSCTAKLYGVKQI
tara:strand:+ start:226 stop:834 length:609 start_codon:yes stop_codon:yes gene_type:complete